MLCDSALYIFYILINTDEVVATTCWFTFL